MLASAHTHSGQYWKRIKDRESQSEQFLDRRYMLAFVLTNSRAQGATIANPASVLEQNNVPVTSDETAPDSAVIQQLEGDVGRTMNFFDRKKFWSR